MKICKICRQKFQIITNTHLRLHRWTIKRYTKEFGHSGVGFPIVVSDLSHSDPRYIRWRECLRQRPPPWSKGQTKETHPSVKKISQTFKRKGIDNFARWRVQAKKSGQMRSSWPPLIKNGDLAELIGMTLGDGHIEKFPRTECLTIVINAKDKELIERYRNFVWQIFHKKPSISACSAGIQCTRIRIYQKEISGRLGVPIGNRGEAHSRIPRWILQNREFLIRYIRGLYEAEGSFCVHKPTSTYKLLFTNRNLSLLNIVYQSLGMLGFHPHRSKYTIQLSRRAEVYACKELLRFREYP